MPQDAALIESLCDLQIPKDIRFSPDSQRILYTTTLESGHVKGKHAVSTIWSAETGGPKSSRQLTRGLFNDHSARWSPDGQSIAFISDLAKPDERWAIYALPLKDDGGSFAVTATENEREIASFQYSPKGKSIAYVSPDEKTAEQRAKEENGEDAQVWGEEWACGRLRIVDLETKESRCLTERPEHVTGFCWSSDARTIAVACVKSPYIEEVYLTGTTISLIDVASKDIRELCHFPTEVTDLTWASDGKLYFRAGVPAERCCAGTAVYAIDPKDTSPTYTNTAFGIENDAKQLSSTPDGEIVVNLEHDLSSHISLLSGRVLYNVDQEISAFAASYTSDSDEIVLAVCTSNVNSPSEVYTTTASGGGLVRVSDHGHAFDGRAFGTCSFISCRSTDQEVDLSAVFLAPKGQSVEPGAQKPCPTLVLVHGGPQARRTNAFNASSYMWTPYLLSQNNSAGILLPNYRGSSGRGQKFAEYSFGGVGVYDYADIVATIQHAIDIGLVDKENIMVGGWSQGGFLSYLCAVRNGDHGLSWKFKAAIPGAGITDMDAMTLTSDLGGSLEAELNGGWAPWNMDAQDTRNRKASALWEFSAAVEEAKKTGQTIVPPMLILHGEKDERCPITQAWGMRRALRSADFPCTFVTYPREPHSFKEQKHWIDMAMRVSAFVKEHIGPA